MKQVEAVLNYMDEFGSISSMEAFQDLGVTRLSAIIHTLRKDNYAIASVPEEIYNRYGKKVIFSRYTFVENID